MESPLVFGKEIGIILSGASANLAPIAIRNDVAKEISDEQLVVVHDKNYEDYLMLGVLRWVHRLEPFLRRGVRTVYIDHPDALEEELILGYSNAWVEIYGALTIAEGSKKFTENTRAPHPGSKVFLVEHGEKLSEYVIVKDKIIVGVHKYSGWEIPLTPEGLRYHVGVFGATGMGKSRLIRALIEEIVNKGFSLIVFDHTGVDYAQPYREKGLGDHIVESNKIKLSPDVISNLILELGHLSSYYEDYVLVTTICYASILEGKMKNVDECIGLGGGVDTGRRGTSKSRQYTLQQTLFADETGEAVIDGWDKEKFLEMLANVMFSLKAKEGGVARVRSLINFFIDESFFKQLNERTISPRELIEKAKEKGFIIVDMSYDSHIEVKQAIIADVARAGWNYIMASRKPLNLGLVVDEAQNYAGEGRNISAVELERIAREGRKWGYFIILASQRVARDIRTSIRSNLGTVFFSKLQATGDLNEIAGYLDLGRLSEASLAMLAPREFFVAGLMNPLRRPILVRVREVS